jgi:hypothetical protein
MREQGAGETTYKVVGLVEQSRAADSAVPPSILHQLNRQFEN